MSDLVRFGVAMDRALLGAFDERIAAKGYENRSEALRDLVRSDLAREAWKSGARVAGTLTFVFAPKSRLEVGQKLDEAQPGVVASVLEVRLDGARSLGVAVLRGAAEELGALAGRVGGTRGVLSAELTVACAEAGGAS